MGSLLVVQHVRQEGLGTFEDVFRSAGCRLKRLRIFEPQAVWPSLDGCAGVVSMGGPQSVCAQAAYPWIRRELALLREAVDRHLPVLGVCLGGQLLAAALGARVTKNPVKEIGWYPLVREPGAEGDPLWEPFGEAETVFQWHGDTFALPRGATRLASAPLCREQAFRYGDRAYGLQFHVEMTGPMVRAWLRSPANTRELAALRGAIEPAAIRREAPRHLAQLRELAGHIGRVFGRWVSNR